MCHPPEQGDTIIYNAVISSCSKCARWQTALALLHDFEDASSSPANAKTYNSAMLACVTGNAWRETVALASQMRDQQVDTDVVACCMVVSAFVAGEQPAEAVACMEMLHHRAFQATLKPAFAPCP